MLTSSPKASPTPSAKSPSSPFLRRAHNASSAPSSQRRSPRQYTIPAVNPSRALDVSSRVALPTSTATSSPSIKADTKRSVDAGTQYTPPDFPPTYRPVVKKAASLKDLKETSPSTLKRRESPPQPATAEPVELEVREDPLPRPTKIPKTPDTSSGGKEAKEVSASSKASEAVESSPSKRARGSEPEIKVLDRHYERCPVQDLGILIADMLFELVSLNDRDFQINDNTLTRFHSRAPPAISIHDYLKRLINHATLSPPILLSMVYYLDRLCAMFPAFTISSLTVHRFLIAAATVASKGLSDSFWTNSTYARVGGVSTRELALLELEFLTRLEWKIVPNPETLVDYYHGLLERNKAYTVAEEG